MNRFLTLLLAFLPFSGPAAAQNLFQPAQRWIHQAPAAGPWIPGQVLFTGREGLIWGTTGGANAELLVLCADESGVATPHFADQVLGQTASFMDVAGGQRADALFAIAQYPHPNLFSRRTEITRHDPLEAASGAPFAPVWTHDMGIVANGPAKLACDAHGMSVVAGVWDDASSTMILSWLDTDLGTPLHSLALPASTLTEVAISADGSRVAVVAGLELHIFDANATQVHARTLTGSTHAIAFSADGATLLVGGQGQLDVLREGPSGYSVVATLAAANDEIASRTAIAADGSTIAVAWWNFMNGVDARFEVFDGATFTSLQNIAQLGTLGGNQNLPVAARVTSDGKRIAFGTWGNGTSDPEVLLLDRDAALPVQTLDLPGSVVSLDLDSTGTRLVVSHKDAHANQFSATGAIRQIDTGERALQLAAAPELGGALHVAASHPNGSGPVFFLVGRRAPQPMIIPAVSGSLALDRASLRVHVRPAILGRADLVLPIGNHPDLIGVRIAVQAAWRLSGHYALSDVVLDPLILD
jgi:hypothetical protein